MTRLHVNVIMLATHVVLASYAFGWRGTALMMAGAYLDAEMERHLRARP